MSGASVVPSNSLLTSGQCFRLIARLDIKGPNLIKGIHLEGLRVIGDPQEYATAYYEQGADELIYMDSVASLYGRNSLADIVKKTAQNIFVPLTVGGGVRSVEDATNLLRVGADKVAVNTAAIRRPGLITEIANRFGTQCMVLSIEAKRAGNGWEAYVDNGREKTGIDALQWAAQAAELGAGEILLTSVDQEGTGKGFDCDLVSRVSNAVSIPVIASGGMGSYEHLKDVYKKGHANAAAIARTLHYRKNDIPSLRNLALLDQIPVRKVLR